MGPDPQADGAPQDQAGDGPSAESLLEALLVDDAEVIWDPATGKPLVSPRAKIELDRPPEGE